MFKKVLCLTASLAMVAGVFAGCGNKADRTALDALTDQLETVTANYGGIADVVSEYGSTQQHEELDDAKADLDEIAAKVEAGELTKDDAADLVGQLSELATSITNIGEAAKNNMPEEQPEGEDENAYPDEQTLADKFEQVATLLSGVYENIAANGSSVQQQTIADAQEEVSELRAALDAGSYTSIEIMDALELIEALAQNINDDVNAVESETAEETENVNDELEALATLVSGAKENIDAGDSQLKKDFISIIQDTVSEYGSQAADGELTPEQAADILDGVHLLEDIVNRLNA